MSHIEIAQKTLQELYREHKTWEKVAKTLIDPNGQAISKTLVWKVAKGNCNSPRVMRALGLKRRRFRQYCEFKTDEEQKNFNSHLVKLNLNLTQLCYGIMDGSVCISRK